jgi:L-asparaginase/Glu-tRNA(Gln) amidotransferase subunit D
VLKNGVCHEQILMNHTVQYHGISIDIMAEVDRTIVFLSMGGTIDKDYPKTRNGMNFEICSPAVESILAKLKPSLGFKFKIKSICTKDSQSIDLDDR